MSEPSSLENIDLRRNRITRNGIKSIVEALERSDRVRHVHVHAGGKIEAMGSKNNSTSSNNRENSESFTICIVDIRDNSKPEESDMIREEMFGLPITFQESPGTTKKPTRTNPNPKQKISESVSIK